MAFENMGKEVPFEDEVLDWDSEIEEEGGKSLFRLLPEGDYDFTVKGFDRSNFNGNDKSPACPVAKLHLIVHAQDGDAQVDDSLFLSKKSEWKLSQFFICIGQKKHGEKLRMNWQAVPGSTGRLSINHRKYNDKEYNQVARYLEPSEPAVQKKFTPGSF